ncbi:Ribosomal RNA small subunit methyltransferase I OS=Ureibacillus acetophenoni OX=614649 GN=rsmI PE=3 SV=1 [Ureibacillus acetophenoni]
MDTVLGGERKIVLARELTKKFEEFLRSTIAEAITWANENGVAGEFCLVIEGNPLENEESEQSYWDDMSIVEHVDYLIEKENILPKEAIKEVAKLRGLLKRDVYQQYHQ